MNVGSVFIDLSLDQRKFNSSVGSAIKNTENRFASSVGSGKLGGAVKKLGGAIAGAFAAKKVIDFGKACIDLGSDLAEVQNVVDVAFGSMSKEADAWARNAITNFGLSETVAKRYLGVFGSMATSFGFTTSQALDMSEQITGLVGDVASFYNISSDESYTKLKSIFTGETESLKDLGVVMTQTALDQYALANGFGKTTKKMTEQEKVLLRYQFVQNKLANASGDFVRTQDSWANQTRVLSLRWDSLKASIGQGLINALTPVLKLINNIIAKVQVMADAFKSATEKIFGNAGGSSTSSSAESSVSAIGTAADVSAEKVENLKKAVGAQDELNIMKFDDDSTSSDLTGGIDTSAVSALTAALDKEEQTLSKMEGTLARIQGIFKTGFENGLKNFDASDFLGHLESIKNNLVDIFSSDILQESMKGFGASCETLFTSIISSTLSVGTTVANNIVTGVDTYLSNSKEYISEKFAGIFNAKTKINTVIADTLDAVSNIFDVFNGENATNCTASIIGIFSDGFLGVTELASKFSASIIELVTGPFIDNQDKLKSNLDGFLGPVSTVLETFHNSIKATADSFSKVYDSKIGPAITNLKNGFSSMVSKCSDNWNKHMKPVLDKLADKFKTVYEQHIQPALDKIGNLIGSISQCASAFFTGILVPIGNWLNDKLSPIVSWLVDVVGSALLDALGAAGDVIGSFADDLAGVFDWLTKVFNGEWQTELSIKFQNKKAEIQQKWNDLTAPIKDKIASISTKLSETKENVKTKWNNLVSSVKDKAANISTKVSETKENVKTKWNNLVSAVTDKTAGIGTKLSETKENVKSKWDSLTSSVKEKSADVKAKFSQKQSELKQKWKNLVSNISDKTAELKAKFPQSKWDLKQKWDSITSKVTSKTVEISAKLKDLVTGTINSLITKINNLLGKLRSISIAGYKPFGGISNIPKLYTGAYLKANNPQLAFVGDNRTEGEFVAPESKLEEAVYKAMDKHNKNAAGGGTNRLILEIHVVGEDGRRIIKKINDAQDQAGRMLLNI